jgi:ribosomal protein L12E/L44/L45/RPP1/RPP2
MRCANCEIELPQDASFCPKCGAHVPAGVSIQVRQDVRAVQGEVVGAILGQDTAPAELDAGVTQQVDTVEEGGAVVGAIVGAEGPVHVGGEQHYVDHSIRVGDITDSTGVAIGPGAQATVTQTTGVSADEIARAFAVIMQAVDAMPEGARKGDAREAVQKLEAEAGRGEQAEESRVRRWFALLAETSADAWEAAVNVLANPIAGIGTVFGKIAARAREESPKH